MAVAKSAAIDLLPTWANPETTTEAMSKRNKRTTLQVNRDNFKNKAIADHRWKKYCVAFKGCTSELAANRSRGSEGKKGFGTRPIVEKWNKRELSSPNDRKLSRATVDAAVAGGMAGLTPVKPGRPLKIPRELIENLAKHAVMMQISGEGEASRHVFYQQRTLF